MSNPTDRVEIITSVQRRRRWTASEKVRIVEEKVHGLLLDRHAGGTERRHDGRIAVDERNRRWCSDGFEIGCDNGERVRVAFALDCCDREAVSFLATTAASPATTFVT